MPTHRAKVLVVASGGGHWIQLRRLWSAFDDMDVVFATTQADYVAQTGGRPFYAISNFTRRDPVRMAALIPELVRILRVEKPTVVVTTGAAPGLIALILAKLLTRAKTIWIDSIANGERMSTSGDWAGRFADAWLTQWPDLARPGGPTYWGAVI